MRLVLDTNVVLSGLLWGGPPGQLLRRARAGNIVLAVTVPLLTELHDVMIRERFAPVFARRLLTVTELFEGYALLCEHVESVEIPPTILRDPDDDAVLSAAIGGSAGMIVSGDRDLLDLGVFRNIPIVNAAQALGLLGAA